MGVSVEAAIRDAMRVRLKQTVRGIGGDLSGALFRLGSGAQQRGEGAARVQVRVRRRYCDDALTSSCVCVRVQVFFFGYLDDESSPASICE